MGVRLSSLLGLVGLGLIILRMGRLLRPTAEGTDWRLILAGAVVIGVIIGGAGARIRMRAAFIGLTSALAALLLLLRMATPDTLRLGLLPSRESWLALSTSLAEGWEQVRFGTAPINPAPELLMILVPVFVLVGTVWMGAAVARRPALSIIGVGWFYLLLATVDRAAPGWWMPAVVGWSTAALVVLRIETASNGTRVLGRPSHRAALATGAGAGVAALALAVFLSPTVSAAGALPWRDTSTLGGIRTGVSYNLFVSSVQSYLVAQGDTPVFQARLGPSPVPPDETYWRLITLDRFDGVNWLPSASGAVIPEAEGEPFEAEAYRFRGPTEPVLQVVRIAALRQNFLPFVGSPSDVDSEAPLLRTGMRTRPDGSIRLDGLTRRDLEYVVTSSVPAQSALELATSLSAAEAPVLREAAAQGLIELTGEATTVEPDLADRSRFLQLPAIDERIVGLAQTIVGPAETPLEKALLLETWYRQPGRFEYSVDIEPGHGATSLAAWLFEPTSANYRIGYCEQFATGMAVMARSLGLPTRIVIGFTPGDVAPDGLITVREKNAHAWVEIWLDGVGWVGFDPTPRSDGVNPATAAALGFDIEEVAGAVPVPEFVEGDDASGLIAGLGRDDFLEGEEATPDALVGPGISLGERFSVEVPRATWLILVGAAVLWTIPGAKQVRRRLRLRRARRGDIAAAWAEITDRLTDLGERVTPSMTPAEVAQNVGAVMTPLAAAHARNEYAEEPPSPAQRSQALESFARVERGLRSRPLPDRLIARWRLRSLRHGK